jgi:hypothetical protein
VTELRDKARFKSALAEIFEAFKPRSSPDGAPEFIGAAYRSPLEHTTRRCVIDEVLGGLGWNLDRMTREMVEEARVQGDSTLFLDYLGVNPDLRVPLLIVEGKAWGKPFVAPSNAGAAAQVLANPSTPEALLAKAAEHCKSGGQPDASPVVPEWAQWMHKLHQYVTTVQQQSGHAVQRLAITSGRWWVIFMNPYDTFVANGPANTRHILAFEDSSVIERSDAIFDQLARRNLIVDPPALIQPSQLLAYTDRANIARLFHGLWVVRRRDGAFFDAFPQINLYPAIIVERHDGQLLSVVDQLGGRITVPHRYDDLSAHIIDVEGNAAALLQAVHAETGAALVPSPLTSFPGFPMAYGTPAATGPTRTIQFLKSSTTPNEFLLVTGTDSHFLLPRPTVEPCAGHIWTECHAVQENQRNAAIVARSFEPASFFTTVEPHHCAHRTVHNRRETRCHIAPFEEFLCCRACVFQAVCWTADELARLPCGFSASNGAAQIAATALPVAIPAN